MKALLPALARNIFDSMQLSPRKHFSKPYLHNKVPLFENPRCNVAPPECASAVLHNGTRIVKVALLHRHSKPENIDLEDWLDVDIVQGTGDHKTYRTTIVDEQLTQTYNRVHQFQKEMLEAVMNKETFDVGQCNSLSLHVCFFWFVCLFLHVTSYEELMSDHFSKKPSNFQYFTLVLTSHSSK